MTARTGLTTIAIALALSLAGLAVAAAPVPQAPQSPTEHGQRWLQKIDLNRDGVIDRSEATSHPRLGAMFNRMDRNGDGALDAGERPGRRGEHGKRSGRGHAGMRSAIKLDADGDGRISKVEAAQSRLAPRFDQLDRSRDGYLVGSELRAGAEQRRREHASGREQAMQARFAAADADRDGRLSRAEVEAHMPHLAKAFAFLDEDRDGFLNRTDLKNWKRH